MDIHGVRFDIYATDDKGSAIEIEMQVINTGALPKRMRFYGSMVDTQLLEREYHMTSLNLSFAA
jgi:predicted transposase/invertase (TIGR01784 family)